MGSVVWSKGCSVAGLVQGIMQNFSWRQIDIWMDVGDALERETE